MINRFFHDIFGNNFGGVLVIDNNYKIQNMNKAAERITGFKENEAVGKYCYEILRTKNCKDHCPMKAGSGSDVSSTFIQDIITKDNKKKYLKSKIIKVEGHIIEIFTDITREIELEKKLKEKYIFDDIITRYKPLIDILKEFPKIALSNSSVLFEGESGVGKEVFANVLQMLSDRKEGPFIKINCAALPDTLLESELFGYKKGAFTDAQKDKPGYFVLADKGTILFDEISEMSIPLQAKILRAVETGVVIPLGSTKPEKVDVRILAASNKDLLKEVEDGTFRDDLYYRLNVVNVKIPALRDRKNDIPLFVDYFIDHFNLINEKSISGMSDSALKILTNYSFPGNVREMRNIMEHSFIFCNSGMIQTRHLPDYLKKHSSNRKMKEMIQNEMKKEIVDALKEARWNQQKAAEILKIDRTTLWRKMKKFDMV